MNLEGQRLTASTAASDHRERLSDAGFHPSGRLLLTASDDKTVQVYETTGFKRYAQLSGHSAPIKRALFSPDGASILTTSLDGTARLWPTDPRALALARKPRDLSAKELQDLLDR